MNMIQQQHRNVTRKRSNEQGDNGCPEKKEKAELGQEEEAKAAKGDLEDGIQISSIQVTTQVTVATHIHTKTQADQPCCIQSVLRLYRTVRRGEPAGNLLKAVSGGEGKKIAIDFTGALPNDPATEFHIEKSDDANVLRYRSGDDNYYLAVQKSGQVILRKLVNFPATDKYFFRIRSVGSETFHTFKSLKTGEYLHCSDEGKAFMKEAKTIGNAEPEDRKTWFSYKPSASYKTQEHFQIQYKKEDMVFAENESYIEFETDMETFEDTEDSGKGNSKEPEKRTSEDSGMAKNSEDPEEKENSNDPGRGITENPGEGTPKDLKEGNSEDSGMAENSEDREVGDSNKPGKENSNDPGSGVTEKQEGVTTEDLKEGNSVDSGMVESSEDPEVGDSNDPGKENSNDPSRGITEKLGEVTPEDLKEGNSKESGIMAENSEDREVGDSNDPGKENSNDPNRGITEKLGEVTPEDLKAGNSDESGKAENSEDAGKSTSE